MRATTTEIGMRPIDLAIRFLKKYPVSNVYLRISADMEVVCRMPSTTLVPNISRYLAIRFVNINLMPAAIHLHDPCGKGTVTIGTFMDNIFVLYVFD